MTAAETRIRPSIGALSRLKEFWVWWTSALIALIPAKIKSVFRAQRGVVIADVAESEIHIRRVSGTIISTLAALEKGNLADEGALVPVKERLRIEMDENDDVLLRLPEDAILRRRLSLPFVPPADLQKLLTLEVARQSPIDPAQILFDYRVLSRDQAAGVQEIELRIAEMPLVEHGAQSVERLGLKPVGVVAGASPLSLRDVLIPLKIERSLRERIRQFLFPLLLALIALLLLLNLGVAFLRDMAYARALESEVASAKSVAERAAHLRVEITAAEQDLKLLGTRKQAPLLITSLAEITRLLPDDSWVYTLDVASDGLKISGFSKSASSLIERFDKSPRFAEASFRAPLVQSPDKTAERFELAFKQEGSGK